MFIDQRKKAEPVLLVQMDTFRSASENQSVLEEFDALARSAGLDVLAIIRGKSHRPEPKFFVRQGKAEEIRQAVQAYKAAVVLFNHRLSPAQIQHLETLCGCRVLDRTALILDVFAQRARTFEGKLQVELAQLEHLRTQLIRRWTHLERQKGGIGLRGPGEKQLETDRRLIDVRIRYLKKRLEKVKAQRQQSRRARHRVGVPVVSVVGYTSAGKSTLFNRLTHSSVDVASKLFSTLDPILRRMDLQGLGRMVLADTVGFIRDLPHELVAAFSATLEETKAADLLLHVVDAHRSDALEKIAAVDAVLKRIGAQQVPQLLVYNKIDLLPAAAEQLDCSPKGDPHRVWVSAQTGEGIGLLCEAIKTLLEDKRMHCEVILSPLEVKSRAKLYDLGVVQSETINEEGHWIIEVDIDRRDYERLFRFNVSDRLSSVFKKD